VNATLPATACATASSFPGGQMAFFAYNADEPKGMTIFARAAYVASFPPGSERLVIIGPEAGSGPGAGGDASRCAAVLAVAGAGLTLAGLRWRRRDAATVGRRRE
jgi:hypothetical protein